MSYQRRESLNGVCFIRCKQLKLRITQHNHASYHIYSAIRASNSHVVISAIDTHTVQWMWSDDISRALSSCQIKHLSRDTQSSTRYHTLHDLSVDVVIILESSKDITAISVTAKVFSENDLRGFGTVVLSTILTRDNEANKYHTLVMTTYVRCHQHSL